MSLANEFRKRVKSAGLIRHAMNLWPPFLFAGISIVDASDDLRHVVVRLRHSALTANYFGTHYGGSLFSMCDPFWALMIVHNIDNSYLVWDKAAEIEFVTASKEDVFAAFDLSQVVIDDITERSKDGDKVLQWFTTPIVTANGEVVARVRKQVYVRKKRAA